MSKQPPTQELAAKDLHGNEWRFKHIFRGNNSLIVRCPPSLLSSILLCLSIVTDGSGEFQVSPVDTCFRVVGVFLLAPKGLSLGMRLYFLGLFYPELGFQISLVILLWKGTNSGILQR